MKMNKSKKVKLVIGLHFIIIFQFVGCSSSSNNNSNIQEITKTEIPQNQNVDANVKRFEENWKNRYEKDSAELKEQEKKWKEQQIHNYSFVIEKITSGVYSDWNRLPVLIKVRNSEKYSIEKVSSNDTSILSKTDGFEDFDTIDKLFSYLQKELKIEEWLVVNIIKK